MWKASFDSLLLVQSPKIWSTSIKSDLRNKSQSDTKFVCRDGAISSHRLLLVRFSGLFRKILWKNPECCQATLNVSQPTIVLCKDLSYKSVKNMLRLLYRGEADLESYEEYSELLEVFRAFQINFGDLSLIPKDQGNIPNGEGSETRGESNVASSDATRDDPNDCEDNEECGLLVRRSNNKIVRISYTNDDDVAVVENTYEPRENDEDAADGDEMGTQSGEEDDPEFCPSSDEVVNGGKNRSTKKKVRRLRKVFSSRRRDGKVDGNPSSAYKEPKTLYCLHCKTRFNNEYDLISHLTTEVQAKTLYKRALRKRWVEKTREHRYHCNLCGKDFGVRNKDSLLFHLGSFHKKLEEINKRRRGRKKEEPGKDDSTSHESGKFRVPEKVIFC